MNTIYTHQTGDNRAKLSTVVQCGKLLPFWYSSVGMITAHFGAVLTKHISGGHMIENSESTFSAKEGNN